MLNQTNIYFNVKDIYLLDKNEIFRNEIKMKIIQKKLNSFPCGQWSYNLLDPKFEERVIDPF